MRKRNVKLASLVFLPLLGGCLSLPSLPFTKSSLESYEDIRGWTFEGRLIGREDTWVHLESKQGVPFTVSIENFPKKEQSRIRKEAKNLTSPPIPVMIAESNQVSQRNGLFVHVQDAKPFTGRIIVRNNFGQLTARLSCYGGQLHGICTYYWPRGNRQAEVNYDQGRLHGLSVHWYSNGKMQSHGFHARGLRDGLLETFFPSGRRKSRAMWDRGRPLDRHYEWYENGQTSSETLYLDGYPKSRQQWSSHGELTNLERF